MQKKSYPVAGIAASSLAVTLLAGCKITDGGIDSGFTGTGNEQNAGTAPIIWGDPEPRVLAGTNYAFQPEAEDADGDVLEFEIRNKPEWASFDRSSGLLLGVPSESHAGLYENVIISVTDANSIVSLPSFDIRVATASAPGDGGQGGGSDDPSGSAPPSISGTPNTSVVVGQGYIFKPQVDDPDGDSLSFSIVNRPRWLNFNTRTGKLHGTPTEDNLGRSHLIEISVTDGTSIAALPRFRVTVESIGTVSKALSWTPPTRNEDGTRLTNLAGYRIYYGTAPGDLTEMIELESPGITSYVIEGLTPGTYYLEMTSFNAQDLESRPTPEIRFTL